MKPEEGFRQYAILDDIPFEGDPARDVNLTLSIKEKQIAGNKTRIVFTMREDTNSGQSFSKVVVEELRDGIGTGIFYLAIEENTKLTIVLDENVRWRWPLRKGVHLTTKEDCIDYYGVAQVNGTGTFYEDGLDDRISIYCNARDSNANVPPDGFSFTVELEQKHQGGWLPITIDPDIKNPPPGGGGVNSFRYLDLSVEEPVIKLQAIDLTSEESS